MNIKLIGLAFSCVAIAIAANYQSMVKTSAGVDSKFASPAASQEFQAHGDMAKNLTDAQMVDAVKEGGSREYFTASFSCSSGCTVNCTRSCSNCCSHQCGRGY